jgi:hypothetical protein
MDLYDQKLNSYLTIDPRIGFNRNPFSNFEVEPFERKFVNVTHSVPRVSWTEVAFLTADLELNHPELSRRCRVQLTIKITDYIL